MNQDEARSHINKNFFGVEEAVNYFKVKPTKEDLSLFKEVPFRKETFEETDTRMLMAVFPLSIKDVLRMHPEHFDQAICSVFSRFCAKNENFLNEKCQPGWYLISKYPKDESYGKNWAEQLTLLKETEEVVSAPLFIYSVIGFYLAKGESLARYGYSRTSTLTSSKRRVAIGDWFFHDGTGNIRFMYKDWHDPDGIHFSEIDDKTRSEGGRHEHITIAYMRKPDLTTI